MNKYQEPFNNIVVEAELMAERCNHKLEKDIKTVQELIDKATPKKVVKSKPLEFDVKIGKATFKKGTSSLRICPSCRKWLNYNYEKNYCGYCGNALDWSEEE